MSRTVVLGYAKQEDAQAQANNYKDEYKVTVIGPTDQCGFAREDGEMTVWRSGTTADLYVMIATKDAFPDPEGGS